MLIKPVTETDKQRLRTTPMMSVHSDKHTVILPDGTRHEHADPNKAWEEYDALMRGELYA